MRINLGPAIAAAAVPLAALAACTTQGIESDGHADAAPEHHTGAMHDSPVPGGIVHDGGAIAAMHDQYARPRAGPVAATGASAWVGPAPAPAFVAGPLPPAGPPAPVPAAVANRQPSPPAAQPAVAASDIVRPEAAQPVPALQPAAASASLRAQGLALFNSFSCGACHAFADAGASGAVGPSLDRHLAVRAVVDTVTDGRGAMPAFGGQMSDAEILALATYISQFSR
ncbi:MAG TPA: cytochrome c [Croceibacterium sp.]|nr:cytochrome c [Croceibacterium sp.]